MIRRGVCRVLGDTADNPRYIETIPGRGYRFICTLGSIQGQPSLNSEADIEKARSAPRTTLKHWLWILPVVLFVVVVALRFRPGEDQGPQWKLVRITRDSGLSHAPALSRDGSLVSYSSNSNAESGEDLYVKQVAGGPAIRLTFDGQDNTSPDFSPDGGRIVFRSSRNGGGIYEIPTFGGQVRLLATDGQNPKFSPDGSQIAFWTGPESVADAVPGSGALWIMPAAGGSPTRIAAGLTTSRYPTWSPDGEWLLFVGYDSKKAYDSDEIDWWLVSVRAGQETRTGAREVFLRSRLQARNSAQDTVSRQPVPRISAPSCWLPDGRVIFSNRTGDARNLWEIRLSLPDGKPQGAPRRLTTGSGSEVEPACASNGLIAFANSEFKTELWSVHPLSDVHGKSETQPLIQGPGNRENPSLSIDGRYLALISDQSGIWNVWIRDLQTNDESIVASSLFVQRYPVLSPSGHQVAYSVYDKNERSIYLASPTEHPVKLCDGCLRATSWSRDEKSLLVFGSNPYHISVLDIASRKQTPLLESPSDSLLYGRFSPEDRWVAFTERVQPDRARIMIAPTNGPVPIPQSAWIKIADVSGDDFANWSPDGKLLYFTSRRDGFGCLWAQRLNGVSGQPVGEPFPVQHFHGRLLFDHETWSVAKDRIVMALAQAKGDVWVMSRSDEH